MLMPKSNTPSRKHPSLRALLLGVCLALLLAPGSHSSAQTGTIPRITLQPKTQGILIGQRATLSVAAEGSAPLTYQWYAGKSGDTSSPQLNATSTTYVTEPLYGLPGANYYFWVRVSNNVGSADSLTARIELEREPPGIYFVRLPTVWRAGPAVPAAVEDE